MDTHSKKRKIIKEKNKQKIEKLQEYQQQQPTITSNYAEELDNHDFVLDKTLIEHYNTIVLGSLETTFHDQIIS